MQVLHMYMYFSEIILNTIITLLIFLRLLILIHVVAPTNDTQTRSKKKKNYILFTCSMFTKPDDPDIRRGGGAAFFSLLFDLYVNSFSEFIVRKFGETT